MINRQVSDHEREDVFKKDGAIVGTTKLTVSADGAQLIATWKYGEIRDVRVYEGSDHDRLIHIGLTQTNSPSACSPRT